jgi:UDP-N-acetylmuramate--alanine ligase
MPVYPAGEAPIVGAESKDLAQSIRRLGHCRPYVESEFDQVIERVSALVEPDDVVLIQGAGSIGLLPSQIVATLGGDQ